MARATSVGAAIMLSAGLGLSLTGVAAHAAPKAANTAQPEVELPHDPPPTEGEPMGDPQQDEDRGLSDRLDREIPLLVDPSSPDSPEMSPGDARPNRLTLTQDGNVVYATDRVNNKIYVVDLTKNRHVLTIDGVSGETLGRLTVSETGNRALVRPANGVWWVIDTTTHEIVSELTALPRNLGEEVISADGRSAYALGPGTKLYQFDLETGETLTEKTLPGNAIETIRLAPGGERLILAREGSDMSVQFVDARTFDPIGPAITAPDVWFFYDLGFAGDDASQLYIVDYFQYIFRLNVDENAELSDAERMKKVSVGSAMTGFAGSPIDNRAWGTSLNYSLVQLADYETGTRPEGFRAVPGGPGNVAQRPNGELVVSNGLDGKRESLPVITVLQTPSMTDPVSTPVQLLGDEVAFRVETTGIKEDKAGGVQWQSSTDGVTWSDIDGATSPLLTFEVSAATAHLQYRATYHDDFWNQSGTSKTVTISSPAPSFTTTSTTVRGVAGEELEPVALTAKAQSDQRWSATPLPEGITLNHETGVLSGTPEQSGSLTATVTVDDAFGTATTEVRFAIDEPGGSGGTPVDPDPNPGTGPETPDPTKPGQGTNGGNSGGDETPQPPHAGDGKQPNADGKTHQALPNTGSMLPAVAFSAAALLMLAGVVTALRARRP
ncbi:putative Ig domain-containing protein [Leucobacter sp. UCMA 4100]|uniref:putative Ig domain-containing protein n=1 Tax=Leucobacter sp. UCMA 4100 TaxID=2810534 RepID=UPI0022EAD7DE|nr:putative Ig domain-containing protein [Leucobacter sp. UCMA 4100]MDA3148037.1 putative Ig domain-containing protein [Leucobacter sp. UCMA 4100]